jgi:hypothetical protein
MVLTLVFCQQTKWHGEARTRDEARKNVLKPTEKLILTIKLNCQYLPSSETVINIATLYNILWDVGCEINKPKFTYFN